MLSNEPVATTSCHAKPGKVAVTPEPQSARSPRVITEHAKDCFCTRKNGSVGLDQVHSRTKAVDCNVVPELLSDRLKRGKINPIAYGLLPTPNPPDAKIAVRIIDE